MHSVGECSCRIHGFCSILAHMRKVFALLLAALVVASQPVLSAPREAQGRGLARGDQRAAIHSGRVIRPGTVRGRIDGKVVRMRLCRGANGLVWHVTALRRNGRVVDHRFDGASGELIR